MTSITLNVTGARIQAAVNGPLTSGMVGIPVTIRYDDSWNGLIKNLVCRCGQWGPDKGETRTVLSVGETATVAHEVMKAYMHLYLGIEGYSTDGKLVIPTTWANCGRIQHGANAGADPSATPELSLWAQLQAQIEMIRQDAMTEEKMAAVIETCLDERLSEILDSSQNLSNALRVAIYNLLMDAAYTSSGHEADKAALEELLTGASAAPDLPDEPATTYYTIEKTLTNVSISNGTATIAAGNAYSATLTANEGYTLGEVIVTMGGEPVTVTDGVIDIACVTGNLVITATAEAVSGYEWESGVPYDLTDKVTEGIELVTGTGKENAKDTFVTTDYLNCFDADAIYHSVALARLFFYDVNKNYISDAYKNANPPVKLVPDGAVYVRLTCQTTYWTNAKVVPIAKAVETYTPGVQNGVWQTGRLDANTGAEIDSSGSRTDYICINGAKCLHMEGANSMGVVCLYDANKTFICGVTSQTEPIDLVAQYPGFSYIRVYMGVSKDIILDDSTVYTVTRTVTQVSYANAANACSGEPYTNTLTAKVGYTLEGGTVTVTMGGTDITESAYNAADGTITIESVTGDIAITATAVENVVVS